MRRFNAKRALLRQRIVEIVERDARLDGLVDMGRAEAEVHAMPAGQDIRRADGLALAVAGIQQHRGAGLADSVFQQTDTGPQRITLVAVLQRDRGAAVAQALGQVSGLGVADKARQQQ